MIKKNHIMFCIVTALLSIGITMCLVWCIFNFRLKMVKDSGGKVHDRIKKNKIIRQMTIDENYKQLINAVSSKKGVEHFQTIWDYDLGVILSKSMFVEEEMFGVSKYRYRPNIGIYNVRVWSGLNYQALSMMATPDLTSLLRKCKVSEDVYFETDKNGFKKTEYKLNSSSFTVFFLGDSFTEGLWVASENTFVNQFGLKLSLNGIHAASINLGVNGYSALEMAWMLEKYAPLFHPQVVIINLFPNDVHANYLKVIKGEGIPETNYIEMFKYLRRMKEFCEETGIVPVVAVIPSKEQFGVLREFSVFQNRVKVWSEEQKVTYIDPRTYFNSVGVDKIYFSWDPHFSSQGHEYYAAFLYENLNSMISEKYAMHMPLIKYKTRLNQ